MRHGYQLVDTPVFEHSELFERGVGSGTDVVDKEMYTFTDRGGRSLTLRPEGTAGVLRATLGASLVQETRPLRVRYAGPMFRYDRPQKGRYRQFSQVGIECIGEASPYLDAEVIEVAWRFLEQLGLSGVSVQVNTLGDLDDRRRYRQALVEYYTPLRDQLCDDCRRRLEINPLRLLDCKRDAAIAARAPLITDSLSAESGRFFETVVSTLEAAGVPSQRNPRLVRGLDYYAHTAFEFWHTSLQGSQNALGGGGRYDGLAETLGFPATPGVGYALGVERILLVAAELGVAPAAAAGADVVVASIDVDQAAQAGSVARDLRAAGTATVLDVSDRDLSRKLRAADRLGARVFIIIGADEARDGVVQVRDLRSRVQERVPIDQAAAAAERVLHRGDVG
jgi:histidyl-tRNA synthetase